MITAYTSYCRYTLTGEIVRIIREGYNGWYVLINNHETLIQNYYLQTL
jgi:hypothetical protein